MPLLERDLFRTKKGIASIKTLTCNTRVWKKKTCPTGALCLWLLQLSDYSCLPGSPSSLNRKPGYHLYLNVCLRHCPACFPGTGFSGSGIPQGHDLPGPGIFSRRMLWCSCILTSTHREIPSCGAAKVGLFPVSALAATVSAKKPRSEGQTLVCIPQVKESFPLMMRYLDCLETTLFVTLSAASFITFVLSACQKETHLESYHKRRRAL